MGKHISRFLVLALILSIIVPQSVHAAVTTADTPTDAVGLKWKMKLGDGYANAPTPPLVIGDYLYVGAGSYIYKLNKNTGAIVQKSAKLAGSMGYATTPPVSVDGKIFITVGAGKVQALDINKLSVLWTSKSSGLEPQTGKSVSIAGQTISPLIYNKGNLYTGVYSSKGGQYFCVDTNTGNINWVIPSSAGYYWSGAYATDNYVVFGSDADASDKSVIKSVSSESGTLIDSMSVDGGVRSTIIADNNNNLYAATQKGRLYKIKVDAGGNFVDSSSCSLSGETTGPPTISDGYIYIGTKSNKIDVIDISNLALSGSIVTPGYAQNGVLISKRADGKRYLYTTYNYHPGGIAMTNLSAQDKVADKNFFIPADTQFCLSPIIADEQTGVLYYKNDSCYLMAVDSSNNAYMPPPSVAAVSYNSLKVSWRNAANSISCTLYRSTSKNGRYSKVVSLGSGLTSYTNTTLKTGTTYYYKLQAQYSNANGIVSNGKMSLPAFGKPALAKTKIKTTGKRGAIKINWRTVSGASGYEVYRSVKKSGKYKKVKTLTKTTSKSWTNKNLKSKRKYFFKVKAYRMIGGKKVYSADSNISYKKVK